MVLRCGKCGSTNIVNDYGIVRVMGMPQTHRCLDCGYIGMFFVEEERVDRNASKRKE